MSTWTAVYARYGTTRAWACESREAALLLLANNPDVSPVAVLDPDGNEVLRGLDLARAVVQAGGVQ